MSKFDSIGYWESRYAKGGNSGAGSYRDMCRFKTRTLNRLIKRNKIRSVIDFGCGDGNQIKSLKVDSYLGLEVSYTAIQKCKRVCPDKQFMYYSPYNFKIDKGQYDMSVSVDVIYHIIEPELFQAHLTHLFISASKMVVIYAPNITGREFKEEFNISPDRHITFRKFTEVIKKRFPSWKLTQVIPNRYPVRDSDLTSGSLSEFFVYLSE